MRVSIRFTNMLTGVSAANYLDHKKIYDSIVANKPEKAQKESQKLVGDALDLINVALAERKGS